MWFRHFEMMLRRSNNCYCYSDHLLQRRKTLMANLQRPSLSMVHIQSLSHTHLMFRHNTSDQVHILKWLDMITFSFLTKIIYRNKQSIKKNTVIFSHFDSMIRVYDTFRKLNNTF